MDGELASVHLDEGAVLGVFEVAFDAVVALAGLVVLLAGGVAALAGPAIDADDILGAVGLERLVHVVVPLSFHVREQHAVLRALGARERRLDLA